MAHEKDRGGCAFVVLIIAALLVWHWIASPNVEKAEAAQKAVMAGNATSDSIDSTVALISPNRVFDEEAARATARNSLTGQSFEDSERSTACTEDCGGHNTNWQQTHEEEVSCEGSSSSFNERCGAYRAAIRRKGYDAKQHFDQRDSAFEKKD